MVGNYCGLSSRFVIHIFDEKYDDVRQSRFSLWPQLWLPRQAQLGEQSPTLLLAVSTGLLVLCSLFTGTVLVNGFVSNAKV